MLYQKILQLLYPSSCVGCHSLVSPGMIMCPLCTSSIKPVVSLFLSLTQKHALPVFAAAAYEGVPKSLLLRKFSQDLLASHQLARLMLNTISFNILKPDYIVPIPLHWTRYARRGFNQSAEIAAVLGKALHIPVLNLLQRKKRTIFQSRLSKQQRADNLDEAFALSMWYRFKGTTFLKDKNILLVDDLCTTGSTLKSAARKLLEVKPTSVAAVVACRAL